MMSIIQVCYLFALTLSVVLSTCAKKDIQTKRIAIVGEGVVGLTTAMAIKQQDATAEITVFHDRPFEETLSRGVAGLFRIAKPTPLSRLYGNETFVHLAELWRTLGGSSGVQLLSGHILSEDIDLLHGQEQAYADIVYNFRFLDKRELKSQFLLKDDDDSSAIHYTAFTSEGATYCPWMKKQLMDSGVAFVQRKIETLDELADEGFPIVVNCAGMDGGRLAGDDNEMYPIRGILLKVDAPWQKHFLMRDFITFTIPTIGAVYIGTVKEDRKDSMEVTKEETEELFNRYLQLQPSFKILGSGLYPAQPSLPSLLNQRIGTRQNVTILDHFVGLRPGRTVVRVEAESRHSKRGTTYKAVHNYGHGGTGFTICWGTALHASALVFDLPVDRYEEAKAATPVLKTSLDKEFHSEVPPKARLARYLK